jgi:hypothetical protein
MRKAIGFVIVLYALSIFFESFSALDSAACESFKTLEVAAIVAQENILEYKE